MQARCDTSLCSVYLKPQTHTVSSVAARDLTEAPSARILGDILLQRRVSHDRKLYPRRLSAHAFPLRNAGCHQPHQAHVPGRPRRRPFAQTRIGSAVRRSGHRSQRRPERRRTPVSFDVPAAGIDAQVVHSLAKWKRMALYRYDFHVGKGIYTDMNAIRR